MSIEFRLPELGENITEAEVAEILVSEGDRIESEQSVMELETEKAVVELPCPHAGVVSKVHVSDGDTIQVGSVVLTIDDSADDSDDSGDSSQESDEKAEQKQEQKQEAEEKKEPESDSDDSDSQAKDEEKSDDTGDDAPEEDKEKSSEKQQPAKAESKSEPASKTEDKPASPEHKGGGPPPPAGPATRHMARRLGVDLRQVKGSADGGRITPEDVEAYVSSRLKAEPAESGGAAQPAPTKLPDFTKFGPVERKKLSKLNRTAAAQLSRSWNEIPHVTQHELADVTDLDSVRRKYMQSVGKDGPKVTVTAVVAKACAQLLSEMPHFNSSFDAETGELVLKNYYHIGVAVDTEHGLVVPVIRDADEKSILEIASELTELADKARDRKLDLADMQGATFTITNLGGIGGTCFTPIVNHPEVAILGLSRSRPQPAYVDGNLAERLMLPLSLSYDHRVINGADAARFVVRLSALLAQPFGLLANV